MIHIVHSLIRNTRGGGQYVSFSTPYKKWDPQKNFLKNPKNGCVIIVIGNGVVPSGCDKGWGREEQTIRKEYSIGNFSDVSHLEITLPTFDLRFAFFRSNWLVQKTTKS